MAYIWRKKVGSKEKLQIVKLFQDITFDTKNMIFIFMFISKPFFFFFKSTDQINCITGRYLETNSKNKSTKKAKHWHESQISFSTFYIISMEEMTNGYMLQWIPQFCPKT